jgi:acetolactate synthase I/III small subunit
MSNENIYIISITTENTLNVLQRIASIFSRHRINIEQLNVTETINKGISHFTVILHSHNEKMSKIVKQLKKIIEVIDIKISSQMPIVDVGKRIA